MSTPSITATKLIDALLSHDILDEGGLVSLLGAERHDVSLNRLEMLLVSNNVISDQRLALLKGAVSGHGVLTEDETAKPTTQLDGKVAKSVGALVLDREPLTVAFVEDLEHNVETVGRLLQTRDFEVWMVTANRFASLWAATYKGVEVDRRPTTRDIFEIFDEAVVRRASDIHLTVGQPPWIRVDGSLVPLARQPLDELWMRTELTKVAGDEVMATLDEDKAADCAYSYGTSRFRLNLGLNRYGEWLVARKLPTAIPTPDDLRLPAAIRKFVHLERGMVLVTGPTGSGKSTTLAALLNDIALNQSRHLITLEDPIEFYLSSSRSLINQRELGHHFLSFASALRQALRQDPDVVLVGELRDLETMRTAITAAETGHLVFGTLHTYDASSTLGRLVGSFPADEQNQVRSQLAHILKGVVSQSLLPLKSGKGRVAAYEILVSTPAVANNLRKPDGHTQLAQSLETGIRDGMQTMEMALADLAKRGLVRMEDAEARCRDVDDFRRRLNESDGGVLH